MDVCWMLCYGVLSLGDLFGDLGWVYWCDVDGWYSGLNIVEHQAVTVIYLILPMLCDSYVVSSPTGVPILSICLRSSSSN